MLDKNPERVLDNNLANIKKEFEKNLPNILLFSEPFEKNLFLDKLITSIENSIIFIDIDLLYTGYVKSGMIKKKDNVELYQPNKENWGKDLSKIINKISKNKFFVIIDSFNRIYNMFDELESAIFINSCIMLLSSLGRKTNSSVIVTAMARKNENKEWILSPGGKQIIKSSKTGIYLLEKTNEGFIISTIENKNKNFIIQK
ncbi:MAG: hypothetical protein HOE93_04180 [Nitrosopumilus sp.]|nr:hypothetical protein [Nitrosopumilus sp.]MBT3574223.1 hypothetical protein [Nitrosopumilus sp.]MBT3862005.1 hypothetical protein [Nitrosopumilus sp.]MBT3956496.1 hypothetical protein [Nitrosopumilus sp.]MBT4299256.1 hypothetical protein [Nitrosopumilus sp.]